MTKREFVTQAYAAALQSSEDSGLPALVTVAQAALESNWGMSKLSQEAHNYFGIKAGGNHEHIQMSTHECEKGCSVAVEAQFAKFSCMADCIQYRDRILSRSAIYAAARQHRGDEDEFIREMAKHWATDPKYADKMHAMLREVKALLA